VEKGISEIKMDITLGLWFLGGLLVFCVLVLITIINEWFKSRK